jgi:DNA-binding response OmpR family regulator
MRSYEWGANSYIVKPVDFEQFAETVGGIWTIGS